jgi:hypothetical protein
MSSKVNARAFTIIALIASAAYFAFVCLYFSAHRMMWADEFDAWNILADPSWRHAFASLNNGADSGPPFYYAIGRSILAVAGLHPVAVRLYSAFCFWLAAVLWMHILRRYFTGVVAVFAGTLAFACNPEVLDQVAQIRFYGELVLAVSVGVRIALWLEEKRPAVWLWFGANFLAGLCLVASHPLGLIYSAAIAFAQLCTKAPARMRVAAVAGTVLSWAYLLIFFQPLKHAAETGYWLHAPNAVAVVHFYDNHPLLFVHYRYVSVGLNLLLLCLAVYGCFWFLRNRKWQGTQPNGLSLLFYISVLLLLMPVSFAIVSHLYKPIFLGRYLLPYYLGLSTLDAAGIWLLAQRFNQNSLRKLAVPLFTALIAIAFVTFREQYRDPRSNLDSILQLSQSMPTVVPDDGIVRQAHFYAPAMAQNLFYVMLTPKPGLHATLYSIVQQGYEPSLVFDEPFFRTHPKFLYVDGPWQPKVFNQDLRHNPQWKSERVATVTIRGATYPVLEFTRIDSSASTESNSH